MHKAQHFLDSVSPRTSGSYIYQLLGLMGFVMLFSSFAHANPFAKSETSLAGISCPANHKMYYVGEKTVDNAVYPNNFSWTDGELTRDFIFDQSSAKKIFKLTFTAEDLTSPRWSDPKPPYYGSIPNVTSNAINFLHNTNRSGENNSLTFRIDWPVSKIGFVIQDLDSAYINNDSRRGLAYAEYVTIKNSGSLRHFPNFHTKSKSGLTTTVTAIDGENCKTNECNIDATWTYTPPNNAVSLTHGVTYDAGKARAHTVAYSDFYFCLAPPKLIVKKELKGNRVTDTDQFEISIKKSSSTDVQESFTTAGAGANITNGSSSLIELESNTQYTITERVMNGSTLGDIANYNASYVCTNNTTNSTTVMPTAAMEYDPADKNRSFTLAIANYGDEITCTINNTPSIYTFSGTVFNDNGGITDAQADVRNANYGSGTYNNAFYFNGLFDSTSETGIAGSTVSLVDCNNSSTVYATETAENSGSNIGNYQITVASATLAGNNRVCIIETNNNTSPAYPIRTTTEKRSIPLTANKYDYPDNDFGRVITKNAALVLKKEQAANDCKFTDFTSLTYSKNPLSSSTTGAGTDIKPGQCIAYKITATNRSNVAIHNFVMRDVLQRKDPNKPADPTVTSVLAGPARAAGVFNDGLINGQNGTITTIPITLPKQEKRIFYFNTQYGSTQSE